MIRLASPDIRDEDISRLVQVLRSGHLVQGDCVRSFERDLAAFEEAPHCAVVSSGTAALHLALLALGIGPGDAVLAPAFTFPATVNAIERVGATPLLCEVDATSYVMTPQTFQAGIEAFHRRRDDGLRLKAVMVVHEFGYPAPMAEIAAIARGAKLAVVEDAACALGTRLQNDRPVGYHSDVACYSFHPRKAITTGEGGALTTRDVELDRRVRLLRNHGMAAAPTGTEFLMAGLNYRMTDFQAAMALGQLSRFPEELRTRRQLSERYVARLDGQSRITLPSLAVGHSLQTYMAILPESVNRADIIHHLRNTHGIECNLGAQAVHCLTYYRDRYGWQEQDFSTAAKLYRSGLALPLHGRLSLPDIDHIIDVLIGALDVDPRRPPPADQARPSQI